MRVRARRRHDGASDDLTSLARGGRRLLGGRDDLVGVQHLRAGPAARDDLGRRRPGPPRPPCDLAPPANTDPAKRNRGSTRRVITTRGLPADRVCHASLQAKLKPTPATRTSENSSEPNLGNNLASKFGCDPFLTT